MAPQGVLQPCSPTSMRASPDGLLATAAHRAEVTEGPRLEEKTVWAGQASYTKASLLRVKAKPVETSAAFSLVLTRTPSAASSEHRYKGLPSRKEKNPYFFSHFEATLAPSRYAKPIIVPHCADNQPTTTHPLLGETGLSAQGHRSKDSPLGQPGSAQHNPCTETPPSCPAARESWGEGDPDARASHCPTPSQRGNPAKQTGISNNHTILTALRTVYFFLSFPFGREGN